MQQNALPCREIAQRARVTGTKIWLSNDCRLLFRRDAERNQAPITGTAESWGLRDIFWQVIPKARNCFKLKNPRAKTSTEASALDALQQSTAKKPSSFSCSMMYDPGHSGCATGRRRPAHVFQPTHEWHPNLDASKRTQTHRRNFWCDMVNNVFLARRETIARVRWDDEIKRR